MTATSHLVFLWKAIAVDPHLRCKLPTSIFMVVTTALPETEKTWKNLRLQLRSDDSFELSVRQNYGFCVFFFFCKIYARSPVACSWIKLKVVLLNYEYGTFSLFFVKYRVNKRYVNDVYNGEICCVLVFFLWRTINLKASSIYIGQR